MSGVGLTGKTKPINGGAFPVWEDIDGQGGLRTVADITARNAVSANALFCHEGMLVYVQSTQCIYELAADLVTWGFYDANPALASQATWFVDPSGNDNNDGKTAGTALLTPIELGNRLCPRGKVCYLTTNVTVNINTVSLATVSYSELILNISSDAIANAVRVLSVIHGIASSAPITLSAATTTVGSTKTRGQLATAAGTFVAGERIRFTSGSCIGAVCQSSGLNGDAQHTFIFPLSIPTIAGASGAEGGPNLIPAAGDNCVVDTILVSYTQLNITCNGEARVFIQDCKTTRVAIGGSNCSSPFAGSGGAVFLSGCVQTSTAGRWINNAGGAFLLACRTISTSKTTLLGSGWVLIQHVIQGALGLSGEATSYGINVDGSSGAGRLIVGVASDFNHPGQSAPSHLRLATGFTNGATVGGLEAENGSGGANPYLNACVYVAPASTITIDNADTYLWGASTSFGIAFTLIVGSFIIVASTAAGTIAALFGIPSLVNWNVGNLSFAYSDNTIALPNNACGLLGEYQPTPNSSQTDGGIYLKNQSGNQGLTTFAGLNKAGLYQVSGYVATTTVDATSVGNITLNVTYTDDSGVVQTKAVAVDTSLTALGGFGGSVVIENIGNTAISWSITGIVTPATALYSVRMRITLISNGA